MIKTICFLLLCLLTSCASYTIEPLSLADQLKSNQKPNEPNKLQNITHVKYKSNNLSKIKCIDKNGKEVWLKVDGNTMVQFKKKDGTYTQAYFESVTLSNDTLYSIESRIAGGHQVTLLEQIENAKIKAEFPKTEPVK